MSFLWHLRDDWQQFRRDEQVALWTTYVAVVVLVWLYAPTAVYLCLAGAAFLTWRRWMIGARCRSTASLHRQTALVTGANSGIGRQVALELSRRGARVIIAARDVAKSRLAAAGIRSETGGEVVVKQLDLGSLASVRRLAADISDTEDKLHLLVNNAGVMPMERTVTEDGHDAVIQINYLGPWLLTHLLTDKLKRSAPARIVNVSSMGHYYHDLDPDDLDALHAPFFAMRRYGTSKLAQILHTRQLGDRLKQHGVTAYAVHPGVVDTDISRHQKTSWWYSPLLYGLLFSYVFRSTTMGAQTVVYCAVEPMLSTESGRYYSDCSRGWASWRARDDQLAAHVWRATETLLTVE